MKGCRAAGLFAAVLAGAFSQTVASQDPFADQRAQLLAEIAGMARATARETSRPAFAPQVMAAIGRVPRHRLVPPDQVPYAYENRPLPIGHGQTISQPYIVALMTDLLDPKPTDVVLEVGTGSGYQAAVLAELVAQVYTIEIVEAVGKRAAGDLAALGYRNVMTRIGDGYNGWPEAAPFDGVLVTAAAPYVPKPLVDQLKPGGRLVIPVGGQWQVQDLQVIEKKPDGSTATRRTIPVRFVPLTRSK
ncbi:MAG: protein-L-isoaspartate(D-aspartate) O-methyltransferase [Bacteroidota bacterium]